MGAAADDYFPKVWYLSVYLEPITCMGNGVGGSLFFTHGKGRPISHILIILHKVHNISKHPPKKVFTFLSAAICKIIIRFQL